MTRYLRTPRRRLFLTASSVLMACGSTAAAETYVTLGGELGFSAVVGLSKDGEAFDYTTFATLSVDVEHSTDYGLIFGGKITLDTMDELKFNHYDHTDRFGVEEQYMFRKTVGGPTNIEARLFHWSGGQSISDGDVVAVKINSDWLSTGGTRSDMEYQFRPRMAENICKLAGQIANTMRGRQANLAQTPFLPTVGPNLRTNVGNGLLVNDEQIRMLNTAGITGQYVPAGQFLAKRQVWAMNALSSTVSVGSPPAVNGWPTFGGVPNRNGGRISVNPIASRIGVTSRAGRAAAVFQTRFETIKITPEMAEGLTLPAVVAQSTASKSATVFFNPGPDEMAKPKVNHAQVFVGPVAEIRTVASSEKLVIGAVCFEQQPMEDENYAYLQPASKVLGNTAASIFVEGGFGTLTLSNEDQSGVIDSDGPWADIVSLSASDSLMVSGDTAMFGITGALAATHNPGTRALDVIVGAKLDLGGVTIATDVLYDNDIPGMLDAWQLEAALLPLSMGRVAFALDSDADWWLEADYFSSGFSAEAQIGTPQNAPDGTPLYWWVNGEIDVNGATLYMEYDQQRDLAFGMEYDLAGAELFARVERVSDDVNLRFGSTLSF